MGRQRVPAKACKGAQLSDDVSAALAPPRVTDAADGAGVSVRNLADTLRTIRS